MKILYLIPDFPYPPKGGGPLRIMGLIPGAVKAGHEVHVLSFGSEADMQKSDTPLHQQCASVELVPTPVRNTGERVKTLLLGQADMETRRQDNVFLERLKAKLAQTTFDIVQFQSLEMSIYAEYVMELQPQARLIYDAYNAEAELQRMVYETEGRGLNRLPMAMYSWIQWRRLEAFEKKLGNIVDMILAVSEPDVAHLSQLAGRTPVQLVANGINVVSYTVAPKEKVNLKPPALVFTGIMDYRPNVDAAVWFVESILPHIRSDVHVYLVGNRPHPRVEALAQNFRVTVTGFVPDIIPYLHEATIFVAPLRAGSGTRFKILEAMSAGCAIVSTTVGATGLNITDGRELRLADNEIGFARVIDELLEDELLRLELGSAAQVFVRQHFDWQVIVPKLLEAYELTNYRKT